MREFQQNVALRIFTDETARGNRRPLYQEIVERARAAQLAGATVITGSLGFGRSRVLHTDKILRLSYNRPLVIEIVDTRDKIQAFLPALADYSDCLVMLASVEAARPNRSAA
jgi:PII-like signaling protein